MTQQKVISRQTGVEDSGYKWGFDFDIDSDNAPKGLSEDIVRFISHKKNEPDWLLEWRLKAFRHWEKLSLEAPEWANIKHPPIDFQDIIYYAAPKTKGDGPESLDDVDPELIEAFDKLGIPLNEQKKLTGAGSRCCAGSLTQAIRCRGRDAAPPGPPFQ